jgi:hypothetical protein
MAVGGGAAEWWRRRGCQHRIFLMTMSGLNSGRWDRNVLVVQDGAEADAARSPVPGWFEEWEQI